MHRTGEAIDRLAVKFVIVVGVLAAIGAARLIIGV